MDAVRVTPTGHVIIATTDGGGRIVLGPFDSEDAAWHWAVMDAPNLPQPVRSVTVAPLSPPTAEALYDVGSARSITRED